MQAPLLLMTDQEGGKIRHLSGAPLLSEKQIGQSADPAAAATEAGNGAGLNLRGLGMNVNLAPVLDVYRQAGGFDDKNERSYSMRPDRRLQAGCELHHGAAGRLALRPPPSTFQAWVRPPVRRTQTCGRSP